MMEEYSLTTTIHSYKKLCFLQFSYSKMRFQLITVFKAHCKRKRFKGFNDNSQSLKQIKKNWNKRQKDWYQNVNICGYYWKGRVTWTCYYFTPCEANSAAGREQVDAADLWNILSLGFARLEERLSSGWCLKKEKKGKKMLILHRFFSQIHIPQSISWCGMSFLYVLLLLVNE